MDNDGARILDTILTNACKGRPSATRLNKAACAGRIAATAWNITEKDHVLSMEFVAGQQFDTAAGAAYDLLMLSGMPTRFRFNGVEVSMTPDAVYA